jgi:hypothetical protein
MQLYFQTLNVLEEHSLTTLITNEYVKYLRVIVLLDLQRRRNLCEKMHIILFVICAFLVHLNLYLIS